MELLLLYHLTEEKKLDPYECNRLPKITELIKLKWWWPIPQWSPPNSATLPPRGQPSHSWEETSHAARAASPAPGDRGINTEADVASALENFPVCSGWVLTEVDISRACRFTLEWRGRVGWGISLRKGRLSPVLMRVGRKGVLSSTVEVPGWNAVETVMRTWDEGGQVGRDMQGSEGRGKEFALNQQEQENH